jgi:di/tricarboxylate transporter
MEVLDPSIQMWLTFGLISAAIVSYILDLVPMEITSLGIISALLLLFHFMPIIGDNGELLVSTRILLSGFSNPALIAILALLVVGHGMVETGALDGPVKILVRLSGNYPTAIVILTLIIVMIFSAFLNNTPVVVIFIPIIISLAEKLGKSPSLILMPLSFVAILGGMTTLIGSSTNLLVSSSYQSTGGDPIGFFDFIVPGGFLATIGFLYMLFIAPKILPDDKSLVDKQTKITGNQFIIQIDLTEDNSLIGKKAIAGMIPYISGMTVQMVKRGHIDYLPPFDDITLEKGDCLVIATTRHELTQKLADDPFLLADVKNQTIVDLDDDSDFKKTDSRGQKLVEVMVAPASRLDGRTLDQTGYRLEGGCKILGIQRRSRMTRASINDIRLISRDILLVVGSQSQIQSLRFNKDVMLMEWSVKEIPIKADTWKALTIFASVVIMASTGMVPISIAALLGAFVMIVSKCLNIRKAAQAIDRNIFTLVAAALAMGASLQGTGGAAYIAMNMIDLLSGASPTVILSAFFLLTAFMTNILSNNATAVLFTPIAVNIAGELGIDPIVFVMAVIFAANCSFATPIGYQTNLLVLAPGNYKFQDFIKVGVPLILLIWISFTFFAPWYYNF